MLSLKNKVFVKDEPIGFTSDKVEKKKDGFYWLYILAAAWYGSGLIYMISMPLKLIMPKGESKDIPTYDGPSIEAYASYLVPWTVSLIVLIFTIKSSARGKRGGAFLASLQCLSAFSAAIIWTLLSGPEKSQEALPMAFVYTAMGAMAGAATFGFIFTSFTPVLCTALGFLIIEDHENVSWLRTLAVFLIFLPGWFIVLLTGLFLGNA